jgi:gliding motility-associated-like protein
MKNITSSFKNINIKSVLIALLLIFITNGYSQNTYDGDYCPGPGAVGDEYATGTVYSTLLLASPSSTCQIGTIHAKVDTQNQVLRLGMDIGNGGSALFRLYLDTNNNPLTGLTSDSFGGTISVAGAEYILEINSNGNGFTLYTGNGSVKTQTNVIPPGLAVQAGNANCNSGTSFLEFNIPFGSLGINICDPNNPGIINVTKLASVSGNSPNSSLCINTPLTFGIPLKGTVGPNSSICSGASSALTITGLNANSTVIKWQSSVAPFSVWIDIPNTAGLTAYNTANLTETTKFRAIFSNSGLCSGNEIATSEATVTVKVPTDCSITGTTGPVCLLSSNIYMAPANMTTYAWSLPAITANGATITSASNAQSVTVLTGSTCNTTFKLLLTTTLNGCSSTCEKIVTVNDTTAPIWTTAAGTLNTTLQCSDTVGLTTAQVNAPVATDNCGGTVTYTKTSGQFVASQSCSNTGTYTNTWTATDACTNESTAFTQVITIEDTTAPTWTTAATALNVTLQCSDTAGLTAAQNQAPVATDNCSGTVTYTKTSGAFAVSQSCVNAGTYTNTWVAKDVCNNSSTTFTQIITIEDTTAPTWTTAATALNITLQCSDAVGLATAQSQVPVATDNCAGTVTYTKTTGLFTASQSCANAGTYTNTWVAKDVCNNTSTTFTQVITIQDNTAPTWTTAATALNITLQCSDTAGLTTAQSQAPIATDNCAGTVTYTKTTGLFTASQSCANAGTYTNTWVAKDVCNNTSTTFTQVITIQDNTAPTWTTAATALNITLQCSDTAGLTTAQSQAPIATDNCAGTVTYTKITGLFTASQSCANAGTYTNTWVAKDVCNNTSTTFTQVITIQDNTAPTWTTAATALNITLQCSDTAGLTTAQSQAPIATDNCAGTVTYTKTTGLFTASQSCANAGTYTNTWVAKDVCNNTSTTFTQVITIQDNTAPTWTTAATALNITLQCSDTAGLATAQSQAPVATDNCSGTVTYTKTSGAFAVSQSCANAGTYTNTWVAKDVCNNTSTTFTQVITIEDTTAPTWTTAATALNVTLQCSDTAGLVTAQNQAPVATDNCNGTVTYTKTSGAFAVSQSCANAGTYTNTWVAKDVCNNTSTTFTQIITIEDTTAPTWTTTATALNITLQCSDTAGLVTAQNQAPVATDNCSGIVTYTKTSGAFAVSQSCANAGTYTNTWVAKDVCNNTSTTFTQIITIEDTTAPTWTTTATALNITLQCSDTAGLVTAQNQAPVATDNCNGTVTYTKTSGVFAVSQSCVNAGTYTNTWVAKDVCNNASTTFTQVITIEDTTAPTWTTAATALNITLQCSDTAGLTTAQSQAPIATDNCAGTVTYTKTSGVFSASQSCVNAGTYTNTWVAKDVCNNTSTTFTQVITIEDTTAPTWTTAATALNVTLQCSDTAGLVTAQNQAPVATDNCNGTVTYTKTSGAFAVSQSCANAGTYTNTWVAKDVCNNTSTTFTQIITIEDTTAPTWTTAATALNITLQCSDTAGLTAAQNQAPVATDNCLGTVTYTKTSGALQRGACGSTGTYTNTWVAKDVCNNTSTTFTQVITIQDNAAPNWITVAGTLNVTLQCSDSTGLNAAQNQAPVASANCTIVTYTKTSGVFVPSQSCINSGTYTNSWIAKDDCGNVTTAFTQVITIEDTTAPTWTTQTTSLDKTIECSNTQALASAQALFPTASDLCDSDVSNIVKVSGQFVASQTCSNAGTYTNTWTVKDDCGNTSATFTQVITIEDTTAPIWTTQAASLDKTIECSNTQALASAQALFPTASDLCDSAVLNIVKINGQFIASQTCSNAGTYTNTWTVKDDCENTSAIFTQVITIEDTTVPTWTTQAASLDKTIECSNTQALASAQALFPTASDLCDSDVLNIVKVSGQFVASQTCSNAGTYTNTWTVKDDCGNTSATFTQVITIEDTTDPVFTGDLPQNITVSCDAVPQPATVEASDNCNENLPIVFSEIKSGIQNGCSTNYTLTRTWTTSDCGGNTASYIQIIKVEDTTAPTGTAPIDVANLQSIADIPVGNPSDITDEADNCSQDINITVSDSNNGASGCEGNAYILTRTYTLTDCAGNKTELKQTFTVENKVAVSGVVSNVTCFGEKDGSILVTNTPGSTVIITNDKNEVVGNTNLPAGTYTLTATSSVNNNNQTCTATATVIITEPNYRIKVSGQIINIDTNTPIANVPVTLIPQGTTTGPILFRLTGADGMYTFSGMAAGSYLVQVQDANLNSAYELYPVDSSLFFTTLEDCKFQVHNFEYGKSKLPVLGDFVWYDTNANGVQDEWYDANNDGVVTKNIPDSEGAIEYSLWEWIDFNGDGSYAGPQNVGELNAGGFGNAKSPNVIVDGPNGYHEEVIIGIQGYWRDRPESANPYGQYKVKLVRDANLEAVAIPLGVGGLVKVLPSITDKKASSKTNKAQLHTVCTTTPDAGYIVNVTPEDLVHLDIDFGVNCKEYQDIVANDDSAGPIAGVNHTTTNVLNVLPNDTIEGVPVTASAMIVTTVTPNEFLQLNPDGSVDVLPNAPVGTLTMVYQICEADQSSNCDTATVTVTIVAPIMTVTATPICVNDVPYVDYVVTPGNFTPVNGVTITWTGSNNTVITTMNDLPLSGRVLWPGAVVDQAGNGIDWPGWLFQNNQWVQGADGFETLRPTATLTISLNPSQTIVVNYPPADPFCIARPTFAIVANDDNAGPISGNNGGTNVINVYTNDTLNGNVLNPADVTLTTVTPDPKGALTLNPDGSVNVAANTPSGSYVLTYQICENADFGNCDTATVTVNIVFIPPVVTAFADTYSVTCNGFGAVGNILSNDRIDVGPAAIDLLNLTILPSSQGNAGITVDALGNVNVASTTPPGTYSYDYQICLKKFPEICVTRSISIAVLPTVSNLSGEACADDSTLINLLSLLPENTPINGTWVDTNTSNALQGSTLNPFGLALGTYVFEYKIGDTNCPRSIFLTMEINDDCKVLPCGNIVVHNAFSPNGDGINDLFSIDSIDETTCYPENTVEIYNRWGILVFETANYNNTTNAFDGTSRGRTTVKKSDGLPTGTYFYIITYKSLDGNNVIQIYKKDGYLYLSK